MDDKFNFEEITDLINKRRYLVTMRPVFNRRALFSDTTGDYLVPPEPEVNEEVTIKFRTARNNVDYVLLVVKSEKYMMTKVESDKHFDYYAYKVQPGSEKLTYHFELRSGRLKGFYDTRGLVHEVNEYYDFSVIPGFKTLGGRP